jgi:nitrogen fixation NifU-like protein
MTRHGLTDDDLQLLREAGYSERAIEYVLGQVNIGALEDPDVRHVEIGECGDLMTLYMDLAEGGVISEARFRCVGCPALAASGSSMTELARGRTVREASALSEEDLMRDLVSLPEDHMHCPALAIATLRSALDGCLGRRLLTRDEHDDYLHFCGLTRRMLEALPSIPCSDCPQVRRCEEDHLIVSGRRAEVATPS